VAGFRWSSSSSGGRRALNLLRTVNALGVTQSSINARIKVLEEEGVRISSGVTVASG
jgi:hypothetical protein